MIYKNTLYFSEDTSKFKIRYFVLIDNNLLSY